jgi:hypothetical protein
MRSKEQIKEELKDAKKQLQSLEDERSNYNGDSGAERYMFFASMTHKITGANSTVRSLEDELDEYSKKQLTL